ncbi:MAG TPA: diaminopimelate decarboxylase [Kofleriaceae bacterium]|jgi:diaminopimelate decarboxylase|nr:diaminopimelate decarboxylase [Kofleriaceae bacterium]
MSQTGPFEYRNDELHCEGVALSKIAAEVGTPVWVYSKRELIRAFRAFDAALEGIPHRVCYAVKANSTLGILKVLIDQGAGADIVSYGELYRWLAAGGAANKVVFSGVGKSESEIELAIKAGIDTFNAESVEELTTLDRLAKAANATLRVALRVNPDVDAGTHPYISTGLKQNKFGISMDEARALGKQAARYANLRLIGVDCHIGSQLIKTSPFSDAIARLVALIQDLVKDGLPIDHIDIGGGLGIDYGKGDVVPSPAEYGAAVRDALAPLLKTGITLYTEPGRAIVGASGALVTRVLFRKRNEEKHFTIVDGAMNDLMRPALYGSFHPMQPVKQPERPTIKTDVVGPICETGDFFARDRDLPELAQGELLWIGAAGAYGSTMSSNYNTRPRAPEVLVDGDTYTVIKPRETYDQLIAGETLP